MKPGLRLTYVHKLSGYHWITPGLWALTSTYRSEMTYLASSHNKTKLDNSKMRKVKV